MKKTLSVLFALIVAVSTCFAQKNLIDPELASRKMKVGDTIVFMYESETAIVPLRTTAYEVSRNRVDNMDSYLGGCLTTTPIYGNEKKKKDPIYTYKGSPTANWTPSSAINGKKMVVLNILEKDLTTTSLDKCNELTLHNIVDDDTIIIRTPTAISKKFYLCDGILAVNVTNSLREMFVGKKYYASVYNKDTLKYDKKILVSVNATGSLSTYERYYREYTITDFVFNYGESPTYLFFPSISIYYRDNFGQTYSYKYTKRYHNAGTWLTQKDLDSITRKNDSIQNAKELAQRNAGHYLLELTKVDKPKNSNVRKGTLTKNNIYEDNVISIKWNEDGMTFYFNLKNMTGNTMKVVWDEALIVNFEGFTERVLHKGADLEALQKAQQPSIIPSLAQLADFFCSEKYFGGRRLIAGYGGGNNGGINDGKKMRLILPVQVGTSTYTYSFTFTLRWTYSHPELREQ